MVKDIEIDGGDVKVKIVLGYPAYGFVDQLTDDLKQKIEAADGETEDLFGWSVAISGDTVAGNGADITLTNATLHNPAGVAVDADSSSIAARNTLFVGTCSVPLVDNGGNIESPGDTCFAPYPGNVPTVPASVLNLGALADNGGPTQTHKPGAGGFGTGRPDSLRRVSRNFCRR